jgi:gamma-glutamylcyclotransferase (GGCT)/AIG2-like uncharacterized protein YtfP
MLAARQTKAIGRDGDVGGAGITKLKRKKVQQTPRIMPEATTRHVFVYGTLRKGERNDINRLSPSPHFVGIGTVKGVLHLVSWYPGLLLGGQGDVVGEVYAIAPELERRLDEIEEISAEPTSEYFKRNLAVTFEGRCIECLVYEINPDRVEGRTLIPSGDWLAKN